MFVIAVLLYIVFNFVRGLISFCFISHATTNMNNQVCERVLRADILFFDRNPVGRILTRFSKDIAVMDFSIAPFFIWCSMGIFRAITVTITIGIINPWLFIGLAISLVLMWLSMKRSVRIMQEYQKLDGILRAPIHSTFQTMVEGLVSLRVSNKFGYFAQDFNNTSEQCANCTFMFNALTRQLSICIELVCAFFSISTTALAFAQKGTVDPELSIISIQSMTDVLAFLYVALRFTAELDIFMTSS